MKLRRASTIELAKIDWLWKGRLPRGALSVVEGDPGVSKSTLIVELAARISRGDNWPDGMEGSEGSSIIFNAEDAEGSVIVPRLIAAGADLEKVEVDTDKEKPFTIPESIPELRKDIEERDVRFISFDPFESFLSAKVDHKSNHHIRQGIRCLEQMAQETNCSVVIVRHLTKDTSKSAIYRGNGSIGIVGASRGAILVSKDPSDSSRIIMVNHKSSWSAQSPGLVYRLEQIVVSDGKMDVETSKVVWTGDQLAIQADDILAQTMEVGSGVAARDAAGFLREELSAGPKDFVELAKAAQKYGLDRVVLFQTSRLMGIRRERDGDRFLWSLPMDNSEVEALMR